MNKNTLTNNIHDKNYKYSKNRKASNDEMAYITNEEINMNNSHIGKEKNVDCNKDGTIFKLVDKNNNDMLLKDETKEFTSKSSNKDTVFLGEKGSRYLENTITNRIDTPLNRKNISSINNNNNNNNGDTINFKNQVDNNSNIYNTAIYTNYDNGLGTRDDIYNNSCINNIDNSNSRNITNYIIRSNKIIKRKKNKIIYYNTTHNNRAITQKGYDIQEKYNSLDIVDKNKTEGVYNTDEINMECIENKLEDGYNNTNIWDKVNVSLSNCKLSEGENEKRSEEIYLNNFVSDKNDMNNTWDINNMNNNMMYSNNLGCEEKNYLVPNENHKRWTDEYNIDEMFIKKNDIEHINPDIIINNYKNNNIHKTTENIGNIKSNNNYINDRSTINGDKLKKLTNENIYHNEYNKNKSDDNTKYKNNRNYRNKYMNRKNNKNKTKNNANNNKSECINDGTNCSLYDSINSYNINNNNNNNVENVTNIFKNTPFSHITMNENNIREDTSNIPVHTNKYLLMQKNVNDIINFNIAKNNSTNENNILVDNMNDNLKEKNDMPDDIDKFLFNQNESISMDGTKYIMNDLEKCKTCMEGEKEINDVIEHISEKENIDTKKKKYSNKKKNHLPNLNSTIHTLKNNIYHNVDQKDEEKLGSNIINNTNSDINNNKMDENEHNNGNGNSNDNDNGNGNILGVHISQHNNLINNMNSIISNEYTYMNEPKDENNNVPYNYNVRNIEDNSSCRNNINNVNLFGNKTYINVPNNIVTKMFNDTNRSTTNNKNNMNNISQIYENTPSLNNSLVITKTNMQDSINSNMNIIHNNNNNNNNGVYFFNGGNNCVNVNCTKNTSNEKDVFNSSVSKKTLNENMSIERPVILNNSQMLEAFIQGRLCLSCDSLDHPMPLCPNNSFVCPNCHNVSHRGNDCPMKCRFCLKYHMGISIMDCLKKARIQTEKNNSNHDKKDNHNSSCSTSNNNMNKINKNSKSNDEKVNIGPRFDISTRPDNSYGRSVYVSNLSEDISNIQLRDTINLHLDNGFVVNIDRQDGYAFVELSNLYSTFQLVQKTVSINFKKLKIQFKKTGQFLIPDNLSQSFGNMKNFNININMNSTNNHNNNNNNYNNNNNNNYNNNNYNNNNNNNSNNNNNNNNNNNCNNNNYNIVEYNNKKPLSGPSNTLSKNIPNHMINKSLSNKGTTFLNIPPNRSRQYNNRGANNKGNVGANKQYNNKNNNNNNKKKTNSNVNINHTNKSNQINNIINNNNINNNNNNNINNINSNNNFNQYCSNNIMTVENSNTGKFTNTHLFNGDTFLENKNKNIYKSFHPKYSKNTPHLFNNQQKLFHATELQKVHQNSIEPCEEVKKNDIKENIKKNYACSNSFDNEINKYHIPQKENNKMLTENNYQKNRNSYSVNTIMLDQNKKCKGNNLFGSVEYKINMENKNNFSNECNNSYDHNFIYNYNFSNDNKLPYKCSTSNNYNCPNNNNSQNDYNTTYNHGLSKVNENTDNSSIDIPFRNHDNKIISDYMNSNTNTTASGFCPNTLFRSNDISNKLMNQEVNIYMNISNEENRQINKSMRNETNKTTATITTTSDNIMNASFFNTMLYVKDDYVDKCDEGNNSTNWIGYPENAINNNSNDNINIINSKNNMDNMNNIIYKNPPRNYMNNEIIVNTLNTFPHENKNLSPKYINEKENDEFEYNTHLNIKSILDDAIEINQNTIDYDQYNYYDNIPSFNNNDNNIDKYTIQNGVDQNTVTNYNTSNYNIQMKEENNYKENDLLYYSNFDKTNIKNEEHIYINKNIWKDKFDNCYNICNDMFFGNNDIYDIFSNFNSLKMYENNIANDNIMENIGKHVNIDNIMNETTMDHIENDGTIDPIENDVTIDHTDNNGEDNNIAYNDTYIFNNNIRFNNTRLNNDTFQNVEDWNKNKLSDILKKNENIMFDDNKDMTNENEQNKKDIDDLEILNIPYMKNMKDKELDAIEQDLERHIKALWNIRKIKIVKSYDVQK
ncbi:RNA-binding protein, putative [Plasmodium sp. gorilla clade G1]|nr:RNA-binding protein, putative [Plasmodium sp. gorilla clade G1]